MVKTSIPPVPQQIFPSACAVNDESVVVREEGECAFHPKSSPSNVEEVTCDTNNAVEKDERTKSIMCKSISYR